MQKSNSALLLASSTNEAKLAAIRAELQRRSKELAEQADDALDDRDGERRRMLRKRQLALQTQEEKIGQALVAIIPSCRSMLPHENAAIVHAGTICDGACAPRGSR